LLIISGQAKENSALKVLYIELLGLPIPEAKIPPEG
jgi:hypothetical protein